MIFTSFALAVQHFRFSCSSVFTFVKLSLTDYANLEYVFTCHMFSLNSLLA